MRRWTDPGSNRTLDTPPLPLGTLVISTGVKRSGEIRDVSIPFVALLLISLDMTGDACVNIRRFEFLTMNTVSSYAGFVILPRSGRQSKPSSSFTPDTPRLPTDILVISTGA